MIGRQQLLLAYQPEGIDVTVTCVFCGREQPTFHVGHKEWENYSSGRLFAKDAFPYLSAEERELLISAVCSKCWDELPNEQ